MRRALLYLSVAIFLGALGLSWLTHGTGVVTNDIARNIYIPKELTMPLQVKAAYNGRDMLFRYRWPAKQPSIYHDMLKFEGGNWVRYGSSVAGPQPQGIYEDRVTMLVDDAMDHAVRIALLTTELITNAVKHAGPGRIVARMSVSEQTRVAATLSRRP